ncbi:17628_t:CDS:1, partial [Racocetra fulgida]
ERQEKIERIQNVVIRNQIIDLVNYNIQTSSYEQSESGTINLSNIVHTSMLDDNENNSKNIIEDIDSKKNNTNANNSDNITDEDLTNDKSIIKEWTKIDKNENNELEENKEPEEISIDTLVTINRLNCHPADHEKSKIELQYLFSHILTQLLFVYTFKQDIENVEATQ